jgi:hypothetical protein
LGSQKSERSHWAIAGWAEAEICWSWELKLASLDERKWNVLMRGLSPVIIASMIKDKGSYCDSRFAVRNWRLISYLVLAQLFWNFNETNICWKWFSRVLVYWVR